LDELVQDCSPATFGCDGENVFDEKIRKAGALAADFFSTNFNPYDFGIVDAVAQELLPGILRAGKQPAVKRWGVVAELYKLNVYSAPSGMFKPHVDTPVDELILGHSWLYCQLTFKVAFWPTLDDKRFESP
jgi:hypothetical protein